MARWGSVDFREFKRVCKKMEELTKIDLDKCSKRISSTITWESN